ncbi:MAG TPA: prealbumin-like fold domain-containing protein, partial [Nitriliruptorales bacterium]
MSYSNPSQTLSWRARNRLLALMGAITILLPSVVFNPSAQAALPPATDVGGFEIDGNLLSDNDNPDTVPGTRDWDDAPAPNLDASVAGDDILIQGNNGGKEDSDPYVFVTGNVNAKDDLTRVYLDSRITGPTDAYIWAAFERLSGLGSAHVIFEFNQAPVSSFHLRQAGDLRVSFGFGGQGQNENASVLLETWDGADWVASGASGTATVNSATNQPPLGTVPTPDGRTLLEREFGEMGVNLASYFTNANFRCANLSTVWARTRASESEEANVFDKAGPYAIDIDLCSTLKVQKQDAEGRGLSGAEFELWLDDGDGTFETDEDTLIVVDDSTDPDTTTVTTATDGWAEWDDLERGDYFVREVVAPTGYALSSPTVSGPHGVDFLETVTVPSGTFTNPRIPYRIDVSPHDDVNPVGDNSLHTFTVSVQQEIDGTWGAVADGTAVAVAWSGDGAIQTNDCASGTVGGACTVTVDSDDPGAGTLTATFDTPYQHVTGTYGPPDPPTSDWVSTEDAGTFLDKIADAGDKAWRGFLAQVESDDVNLVDEQHTFTVTVWETPDGTTTGALASGVDATLLWTAPGGATSNPECTTGAGGTCTVFVNSSSTGTGFIQITQLDGQINGQDITVSYTAGSSDPAVSGDRFASKTWVDFRVSISPESATNHVDWDHTFVVTVERDSGSGWTAVNGVDLTPEWKGPNDANFGDLDPCTTSTTAEGDGTCLVTVDGGTLGT